MRAAIRAVAALSIAVALVVPAIPAHADQTRDRQWHLGFLKVAEVHRQTQGAGVVVAVIDTGVDANHPDLQGNVLPGTDIVPGGSGDGRQDADGHGTGMAGLIAGHGHGSGDGVLGVAPQAKILPIRINTPSRVGDTDDLTRAIEWATDHNADIVSISTGGGVTTELLRAVNRARSENIVIVAAAGNRPRDTAVITPARFQGVVAAAAVDRIGNHSPQSVTGVQIVLAAPGVEIVSPGSNGQYSVGNGTSDSTAIIAGAAALVRAKYPNLTADEVVRRLTATATDKGPPGRDTQYGFGVLNLVAALTADIGAPSPTGGPTQQPPTSPVAGPTAPSSGGSGGSLLAVAVAVLVALAGLALVFVARARRGRPA